MSSLFSPTIIAGIVLRPLPHTFIDVFIQKISQTLCQNHPAVIKRLTPIIGTHFLIRPIDLPYSIDLLVKDNALEARLCNDETINPDVSISGSLLALTDMLRSNADGDALFFSREISVEGDTEALLTLRNALDSEDIHFKEELLEMFGPLRKPVGLIANNMEHVISHIKNDMEQIAEAITSPLSIQKNILQADVEELREEVANLKASLSKQKKYTERLIKKGLK